MIEGRCVSSHTMWYLFLLHVTYSTAIGEWISLITAVAGGVGIAAVQLVKGRF